MCYNTTYSTLKTEYRWLTGEVVPVVKYSTVNAVCNYSELGSDSYAKLCLARCLNWRWLANVDKVDNRLVGLGSRHFTAVRRSMYVQTTVLPNGWDCSSQALVATNNQVLFVINRVRITLIGDQLWSTFKEQDFDSVAPLHLTAHGIVHDHFFGCLGAG